MTGFRGRGGRLWDVMKNGLYSIHVTLLDGRAGKGSGVILFRDGQILGGDAYLFYTGSYTVKGDTFKGEVLVQRHLPARRQSVVRRTEPGRHRRLRHVYRYAGHHERDGIGGQGQPDFRRHAAPAGRHELAGPRTRKKSSVSSCLCQTNSPFTFAA